MSLIDVSSTLTSAHLKAVWGCPSSKVEHFSIKGKTTLSGPNEHQEDADFLACTNSVILVTAPTKLDPSKSSEDLGPKRSVKDGYHDLAQFSLILLPIHWKLIVHN